MFNDQVALQVNHSVSSCSLMGDLIFAIFHKKVKSIFTRKLAWLLINCKIFLLQNSQVSLKLLGISTAYTK